MEFCFTCLFYIPNWDIKCLIFFRLAFNIVLEQPLVEFSFPCHEIIFYPVKINIKPMLWYFWLSLKGLHCFCIWNILNFLYFSLTPDHKNLWIQTIFKSLYIYIIFDIIWNILWHVRIYCTLLNKTISKYFNFFRIIFMNCLLGIPPCLIIISINIIHVTL